MPGDLGGGGGGGKFLVSFHTTYNGTFAGNDGTKYLPIAGSGNEFSGTAVLCAVVMPFNGTIKNLSAKSNFFNLNADLIITLQKNGSDTPMTVTYTQGEGADVAHYDNVNQVSFVKGDTLNYKLVSTATAGSYTRASLVAEIVPS